MSGRIVVAAVDAAVSNLQIYPFDSIFFILLIYSHVSIECFISGDESYC